MAGKSSFKITAGNIAGISPEKNLDSGPGKDIVRSQSA